MEATVNRNDLQAAFGFAVKSVSKRPVVPVLGGMLVTVDCGTLTLAAFDYEVSRRAHVPAAECEPGVILVDAALLKAAIAALPRGTTTAARKSATARLTASDTAITVGTVTLQAMPMAEYPELPAMPAQAGVARGEDVARIVAGVAIAAGRDDTLPMLTGVSVTFGQDGVRLTATDRYRLAMDVLPWTATTEDMPGAFTLPARPLAEFARIAAKAGKVTVHADVRKEGLGYVFRAGLATDTREITMPGIRGEFPKLDRLMADKPRLNIAVDAAFLAGVVGRLAGLAGRMEPVRLSYANDELTATVTAGGVPTGVEVIPVKCGAAGNIGFNAQFLLSMLAHCSGEVVLGITVKDDVYAAPRTLVTVLCAGSTRRAALMSQGYDA